ncbi:MAG: hypothetical protein HUU06_00020 [Planctomycetaceae bacterium]|nr:hypothetical protein [Planctomycetota bacterium]NUN51162.1 hypothetical protein [Planctomycetaceae bacterium]
MEHVKARGAAEADTNSLPLGVRLPVRWLTRYRTEPEFQVNEKPLGRGSGPCTLAGVAGGWLSLAGRLDDGRGFLARLALRIGDLTDRLSFVCGGRQYRGLAGGRIRPVYALGGPVRVLG